MKRPLAAHTRRWTVVMQAAAIVSAPIQLGGDDRKPDPRAPKMGNHIFWRVDKPDGGSLFFLGSLHFGDRRLYPMPAVVEQTFDRCDRVMLETDLDGSAGGTVAELMMQAATAGPGETMFETVSDDTFSAFEEALDHLGVNPQTYEPYRTWYCANSLMTNALRHAGVFPGLGIDRTIFGRARADGKTIEAFETPEFQIDLFAGLPDPQAEQLLLQALAEIGHTEQFVEQMIEAYLAGDLETLQALVTDGFNQRPALKKRFFTQRNAAWMVRIRAAMKEATTDLVVVGAGHLIGPDGLIERCRQAGWTVTRL